MKLKTLQQKIQQHNKLDKSEVDHVICFVLNINRAKLFIYDEDLSEVQTKTILKHLDQLNKGLPFAYITGIKDFWKLELSVNQHTLIPRPETELLVEKILKLTSKDFSGNILDLGTGSGAIALSIAFDRKQANILATDFSDECLKIAVKNRDKYQLNKVKFLKSNWFDNISDHQFDFIVSNPPYVAEKDPHLLDLKYEPITALTAKNNGMQDIQTIIEKSKEFLKDSATLMIEHGYNQAELVKFEFQQNNYIDIELVKDLAGIPRITIAKFQKVAIKK